MTQWLTQLITDYGYWIVFFGAAIEGESVILVASALAASGYFSILYVALVTFVGTLVADQAVYLLGTLYGPKTLTYLKKRFHMLESPIDKGLQFLKKHETWYILSFRFIYGIRIISPFIIGAQHVSFAKFSYLNILAATIWTVVSCAAGYGLGSLFHRITQNVGMVVAGVVVVVGVISFLVAHIKYKKS